MMQALFNNSGVAQLQHYVLNLPAALLSIEVAQIQEDFISWMNLRFSLHINQQSQLLLMDAEFRHQLSSAIATSFAQRKAIDFYKETKDEDDVPDIKDIIIFGLQAPSETNGHLANDLRIEIRYKKL